MNTGCETAVTWTAQCNVLNELIDSGLDVAARMIGSRPPVDAEGSVKVPEQCLAVLLDVALSRAIERMRRLNMQLDRIADRF